MPVRGTFRRGWLAFCRFLTDSWQIAGLFSALIRAGTLRKGHCCLPRRPGDRPRAAGAEQPVGATWASGRSLCRWGNSAPLADPKALRSSGLFEAGMFRTALAIAHGCTLCVQCLPPILRSRRSRTASLPRLPPLTCQFSPAAHVRRHAQLRPPKAARVVPRAAARLRFERNAPKQLRVWIQRLQRLGPCITYCFGY